MDRDHPSRHLASRLSRLVDGMLDDADFAELEQTLRGSRAARDYYRAYLATHLDLAEQFSHDAAVHHLPAPEPRRRSVLALAALVPLAIGLGWWWAGTRPTPAVDPVRQAVARIDHGPVLAVAARTEGVLWNLPLPPAPGVTLQRNRVELSAGKLVLGMIGGQTLTLRAPARFELINEHEMLLSAGDASLQTKHGSEPYIVRVPGGAIVDLGTEFSAKVNADGNSDVWVFTGTAAATFSGDGDRTRIERILTTGQSARIGEDLQPSPTPTREFLQPLADRPVPPSLAGEAYAAAVKAARPSAFWRFERVAAERTIPDLVGNHPLQLHGSAALQGSAGRGFFYSNTDQMSGFAAPARGLPGLDSPAGLSVECLLYPVTGQHSTALAIEEPDLPPQPGPGLLTVRHSPQRMVVERMGRRGDHIGHLHPDFALRAMLRSPAGYTGGINTYSSRSHLLHCWVHVVLTYDGTSARLYLDGELSDQAHSLLPFQGAALRPIIGRLQPVPGDELRQWSGGIDEVALYGKVLSPAEVRAHFAALDHQ